jgi:hypothetical protein
LARSRRDRGDQEGGGGHSVCDRDSECVRCLALSVGAFMEVAAETKSPSGA